MGGWCCGKGAFDVAESLHLDMQSLVKSAERIYFY